MIVEISDAVLKRGSLTEAIIKLELALILFKNEHLSLGQASKIAGLHKLLFQKELAKRKIPIHYDVLDFERDIENIKLI